MAELTEEDLAELDDMIEPLVTLHDVQQGALAHMAAMAEWDDDPMDAEIAYWNAHPDHPAFGDYATYAAAQDEIDNPEHPAFGDAVHTELTQDEIDQLHARHMEYLATLPVPVVDPAPIYSSKNPPEYVTPPPEYITPEYCEGEICTENAVWGQPYCDECTRLNLVGRSGWKDFYEDWKSGKFIHPDADAPEWMKLKTYAEFLKNFVWPNSDDATPKPWSYRWDHFPDPWRAEWIEYGFDGDLMEQIGIMNPIGELFEEEYELYMNPPYDSPTYAYTDQPYLGQVYPDGEGRRRMKTRKSNSCRSKTKKRKYHKKGKSRKKYVHHKKGKSRKKYVHHKKGKSRKKYVHHHKKGKSRKNK